MKKNVAQMSPDMQKQMAAVIQQTEDQQKKMASDPKMLAMMKQAFAEEEKSDQANYQERLARWEKDYPADVKQLVARRLRAFLDESAGVDFAAKLGP